MLHGQVHGALQALHAVVHHLRDEKRGAIEACPERWMQLCTRSIVDAAGAPRRAWVQP